MKYVKLIFAFFLLFITSHLIYAQEGVSDPRKARLVTTDISNFWKMYDHLPSATSKEDSIRILNDFYISKASSALQEYFADERKNKRVIEEEYLEALRQYPKYFGSIRSNTENIKNNKDKIYQYFASLPYTKR